MTSCGVKYAVSNLADLFPKLIKIVDSPVLTTYDKKISACNLLRLLAQQLQTVADIVIGYYQSDVTRALESASHDRVLKVQQAAHAALKEWQRLRETYLELEKRKVCEEGRGLSPEELLQSRLQKPLPARPSTAVPIPRALERRKTPSAKPISRPSATAEEAEQWGSAGGRYLKRRMGTGGGYVPLEKKAPVPQKVPENIQRESIRSLVQQFIGSNTHFSAEVPVPEPGNRWSSHAAPIPPEEEGNADPVGEAQEMDSGKMTTQGFVKANLDRLRRAGKLPPASAQEAEEEDKAIHDTQVFARPVATKPSEDDGLADTLVDPQTQSTQQWMHALGSASRGQYEEAYQTILRSGTASAK